MDRTTHMGHEHIRHAHADAALSLATCKSDPFESLRSKGFDEFFAGAGPGFGQWVFEISSVG